MFIPISHHRCGGCNIARKAASQGSRASTAGDFRRIHPSGSGGQKREQTGAGRAALPTCCGDIETATGRVMRVANSAGCQRRRQGGLVVSHSGRTPGGLRHIWPSRWHRTPRTYAAQYGWLRAGKRRESRSGSRADRRALTLSFSCSNLALAADQAPSNAEQPPAVAALSEMTHSTLKALRCTSISL